MPQPSFNQDYYTAHDTADDRIALWYYARVVRALRPQGGRLLDFGCGTGHLLKRLAPHFEAVGYDVSPFARAQCRLHAPQAVVLEEWETLPRESLEVVVALHSLEHIPRPHTLVAELSQRLVPGGLFFAVVPNPGSLGHRLKGREWFAYRDPTHCSLLGQGEWVMLFKKAGLELVAIRGDGLWDAPYIGLLPTAVQRVLFGAPAALQVFSPLARPFLPPFLGECLIIQAEKRK